MYLYLIRHGEALPENVDPNRPLSGKGTLDISEISSFLKLATIKVDEIWHSTKLRAKQTAELIAEGVPHTNMVEREGLKPNDPVDKIAEELNVLHENIVIVGHLPFLEILASRLLTTSDNLHAVNFREGGVVCLEKWETGWTISWMMTPGLLTRCVK